MQTCSTSINSDNTARQNTQTEKALLYLNNFINFALAAFESYEIVPEGDDVLPVIFEGGAVGYLHVILTSRTSDARRKGVG